MGSVVVGQFIFAVLAIGVSVLVALLSGHGFEEDFLKLKALLGPRP